MSASSLQELNQLCFYVSGHVTIHPDAAIAADVFLQADPGSHLILGAKASVGPGSILHAFQGTLEIGEEVTIGTKVLMVGSGRVENGACVGAFSTLMIQIDVASQSVIPPHSLIGDESRIVDLNNSSADQSASDAQTRSSSSGKQSPSTSSVHSESDHSESDHSESDRSEGNANGASATNSESNSEATSIRKSVVYGKTSVEKLIQVMFPARAYDMNGHSQSKE